MTSSLPDVGACISIKRETAWSVSFPREATGSIAFAHQPTKCVPVLWCKFPVAQDKGEYLTIASDVGENMMVAWETR